MTTLTLSDTARATLLTAAENDGHLIALPERLPIAARRSVVQSMLKAGLIEEIPAPDCASNWRTSETGEQLALRATSAGLAAVAPQDEADQTRGSNEQKREDHDEAAHTVPEMAGSTTASRLTLREAAVALLAAWDGTANGPPWLTPHFDVLRASIAKPNRAVGPRAPRTDTKRSLVLTLLGRAEGATVTQVAEATGWARHTVHGFFASLKKKGTSIEVLDRVRQIGPGKQGAAGSHTVYRIGEAG